MNATVGSLLPASRDERVGLVLAAALHALLLAALAWKPVSVALPPPPERMTVTLTESVGLTSTSLAPAAEAAADVAPRLGEPAPPAASSPPIEPKAAPESPPAPPPAKPAPPAPKAAAPPKPQPAPKPTASAVAKPSPAPIPAPRPAPQSAPRPSPVPAPPPVAKAAAKPAPKPASALPQRAPVPTPAARPSPAAASAPARPPVATSRIGDDFLKGVTASRSGSQAARPAAAPGGSRLGDDFLKGVPGAQTSGTARTPPAAAIGPAVQSALAGSISRQLKPHWVVPQGVEAEALVTVLSWSLNRDGSLAGPPQVVRQEGITDANRAQAARHAEQAIRAVQLAAPFNLPAEYHDAWKRVASFRFDRKLSQ